MKEFARVEVTSRDAWRAWLAAHHGQAESIWLVRHKKAMGATYLPYDAVVEEAICFGWVDSLPRKLDETRSMLLLSPRQPGSAWSKVNKDRVERLIAAGRMAAPGLRAVERAMADGSWSALDAVETLRVPADLAAALAGLAGAAARFAAFPKSSRRGILEWIAIAKRPETRSRRVAETARLAADNVMANHPKGRDRPRRA
jgi:uncharacterized protein YdeI (YjbR/CyaY-like superfamily)